MYLSVFVNLEQINKKFHLFYYFSSCTYFFVLKVRLLLSSILSVINFLAVFFLWSVNSFNFLNFTKNELEIIQVTYPFV